MMFSMLTKKEEVNGLFPSRAVTPTIRKDEYVFCSAIMGHGLSSFQRCNCQFKTGLVGVSFKGWNRLGGNGQIFPQREPGFPSLDQLPLRCANCLASRIAETMLEQFA